MRKVYNKFESLPAIRKKVNKLCSLIDLNPKKIEAFSGIRDFGYPHIEIKPNGYNYICNERGEETIIIVTEDIDELLFTIFEGEIFHIASEYELGHRKDKEDSRRLLFSKQEELMSKINIEWGRKLADKHLKILEENPFIDKE